MVFSGRGTCSIKRTPSCSAVQPVPPRSWFVAGTAPQTYAQITDSLRAGSGGHRRSSSSEGFGPNGAPAGVSEPSSSADGYFGMKHHKIQFFIP